MPLRDNINSREYDKFCLTNSGLTAVRTCPEGGDTQISGLTKEGKITEVTLSSSGWTPLPATPLTDRNAISIQNLSGIEIKVQFVSGSTGGYVGVVVADGSERFYNITESIIIYGRATSGTPTVVVEEVA